MTDELERFVDAQRGTYDAVVAELRRGRKTGHWIWFIFPQVVGLGRSELSRFYGITSLEEARAYLAHPILGRRLRESIELVLAIPDATAVAILGDIDALKLRSSMTLFARAAPEDPLFGRVLERFYGGAADQATDDRLAALAREAGGT